jgi:FkbM family methyltransferase
MTDGDNHFVQLEQDAQIFSTNASSFDFHHIFEEDFHEVSAFINLAKDKACLLDVGASRGVYSTIFNKLNPNGIAFAFEGSAQSCSAIKELAEKNMISDLIDVNECMVGDQNGKGYFSEENCGYVQILENESISRIERNIITLDSFCEENKLAPDFIKIDVEGYELEVIQGAKFILEEFSPVILLELHLSYLDQRNIYPNEILKFFSQSGYQISDIQNNPIPFSRINSSLRTTIHLIATPS